MGLWLITVHLAWSPQVPGQGSEHFCDIQAKCGWHSELPTHSGRQFGGVPTKLDLQEQTALPLLLRQTLFGPQGDGSQTLIGIAAARNYRRLAHAFSEISKFYNRLNYLIRKFVGKFFQISFSSISLLIATQLIICKISDLKSFHYNKNFTR